MSMQSSCGKCQCNPCECKKKSHHKKKKQYDFVIVGLGTTGSYLARLLSDDGKKSVLVLELGQNESTDPIVASGIDNLNITELNYNSRFSIVYETNLDTVPFPLTMGRMWGGSMEHNYMLTVRGTPLIYDAWASISGNSKWSYNQVLPYMIAFEKYTSNGSPIDTAQRGTNGSLLISQTHPIDTDPWTIGTSAGINIPIINDYNDPTTGTVELSPTQYYNTPDFTTRSSTFTAFLPVGQIIDSNGRGLNGRKLRIVSNAQVNKPIFKGNRAIGVDFSVNINGKDKSFKVYGKDIILCAGAINSPAILQRGGIGDSVKLSALNIPVLQNNLNVGNNGQCQYGAFGIIAGGTVPNYTDPLLIPALFTDARPYYPADSVRRLQYINLPFGPQEYGMLSAVLEPKSVSTVNITSRDPKIQAQVLLNPFTDGSADTPGTDSNLVATSLLLMRDIANANGGSIVSPDPSVFPTPTNPSLQPLVDYAQTATGNQEYDHLCGTTRMSTSAANGVVDGNLKVFGVEHLYVADNGVVPMSDDGNTSYTAVVLAPVLANYLLSH